MIPCVSLGKGWSAFLKKNADALAFSAALSGQNTA